MKERQSDFGVWAVLTLNPKFIIFSPVLPAEPERQFVGSLGKLFHECLHCSRLWGRENGQGENLPSWPGKASGWVILTWPAGPGRLASAPMDEAPGHAQKFIETPVEFVQPAKNETESPETGFLPTIGNIPPPGPRLDRVKLSISHMSCER